MADPDPRWHRSVATVCLSGTLEDKLIAAAAAGFDGVEIFENDLIASPSTPESIARQCADLGLSVDLYQPFRDFEAVAPERHEANLRRAERKFDLMERLGAGTVLVCSSVDSEAADDDGLAAAQLRALADRAADRGMRIAYEALAWGRHVNTWDHSWRIVREADHPALGLCLDSFHILSRTSEAAPIAGVPGEKIFFLQLADAPRLDMDVLQWSRHHRLFPGQGAFDLPAFLGHVLRAGYTGPISLEVFNDVFRQTDPRRMAVDAMRSLLSLQEAHEHAASGRASLPEAPALRGHAFAEVAVSPDERAAIGSTLTALGFTLEGSHRTKPVQLWRQGEVRIVVNADRDGPASAEIGALAVESDDPTVSAARAEALLAPVLGRDKGPDEADLAAVAAPDGTSVFFCRTESVDRGWLADFTPTGAPPAPGAGLTRVDHVALSQPFDYFDEATLFYRSVLGLEPRDDAEFAAPFGLVRHRSVADPEGRVRIAMTGALLRRGPWSPGVTDPQHIAFATDDIVATARAIRDGGGHLLPIPGNYYDDLDARQALEPEALARMRELGVLYDRDERGEYFHCYTELIGSRVFFEVVQRVGGHSGYGAVNAPVRMAAHRSSRLARD